MNVPRIPPLIPILALVACGKAIPVNEAREADIAAKTANTASAEPSSESNVQTTGPAPLNPPAPGEPGGLPDDRAPVSEAPFSKTSAQGAANVVQTYYALIEQGKYEDAWHLRTDSLQPDATGAKAFADSFAKYAEYHANIGAPGRIEGAAGSLYVDVPIQIYGRMKDGTPFSSAGTITLRRVNDVPGSTAAQREWHIATSDVKPKP